MPLEKYVLSEKFYILLYIANILSFFVCYGMESASLHKWLFLPIVVAGCLTALSNLLGRQKLEILFNVCQMFAVTAMLTLIVHWHAHAHTECVIQSLYILMFSISRTYQLNRLQSTHKPEYTPIFDGNIYPTLYIICMGYAITLLPGIASNVHVAIVVVLVALIMGLMLFNVLRMHLHEIKCTLLLILLVMFVLIYNSMIDIPVNKGYVNILILFLLSIHRLYQLNLIVSTGIGRLPK